METSTPYSVRGALPRFQTTSPGEDLWFALRDLYLISTGSAFPPDELLRMSAWAEPSGALAHFHADVVVSTAVVKLLRAAKQIVLEDELTGDALYSDEGETLFLRGVSRFMVEQMGFAALDLGAHRLVPPLVLRSHAATRSAISQSSRRTVLDDAEESTLDGSVRCYCCDGVLWSNALGTPRVNISLDHLWPRSLGGVSTFENLLPICETCNGAKEDRASWSVFGVVQDHAMLERGADSELMVGLALHRLAAGKFATNGYLTLKSAYVALGPRTAIAPIDPAGGELFFNLVAHDQTRLTALW